MTVVHPIARAWVTTGGTGAQNYDEFADEAEITAIVSANPASALAVEMPHRAPDSLGRSFREALPDAVARLAEAKQDGSYTPAEQVVALYRITSPGDEPAYGLFCMVDTDQISARADEPGLVIRNEDVFIEKVRERVALAQATRHLLSAVLLLQTARGDELHAALAAGCERAGPPTAIDRDQAGRTHAIWLVGPGPAQDELCALAGGGELVVADGNHRTLAAQLAEVPRFLAVVSAPASVTIAPYHRLVTEAPVPVAELAARLRALRAGVEPWPGAVPAVPPRAGTACLYAGPDACYALTLPPDPVAPAVDNLDHALVERVLLRDALGLDPGDKRVTYVGGDYPAAWLAGEVDAGRADLAILVAPVTVDDFVAVNLARQKLPRKSTWFTPKVRAGLVVAELGGA
ncbi:MAG TPA: DUF1015 family protein [Micromonosporaceae bacterium]|nr:DUF1015 family protein [Micromonosporaceae bacterium]